MKAAVIPDIGQSLVIEKLYGGGRTEVVTHGPQHEKANESFEKIEKGEIDARPFDFRSSQSDRRCCA